MPLVAVDPSDEFEREILREFDFMDFDFARQFNFSRVFEGGGDRSVGSFDSNAVSVEYSHDDAARGGYRCRQHRRQRCSNRMYRIESVKTSCWYREFLWPGPVRELTYELSLRDRYSEFRDFFRMPLSKVDELVDIFVQRGYIPTPRSLFRRGEFQERAELLVMAALHILAKGATFKSCRTLTHISTSEVRKFFFKFLDAMFNMKDEYIFLPANLTALKRVMQSYTFSGLPGACGSMDVVHIKWSNCPAGDYNRAKGKECYPTLAFQCITDNSRRILSVYGPQFGTRNDKEIVKLDPNVRKIRFGWYSKVYWRYYTERGGIGMERGVYVICDNGYLRWPQLICPFTMDEPCHTESGYFLSNLESVRKDVECTFGILKKRWRILDNGLAYRAIGDCEKIFLACCCLHNFLLDVMERSDVRVGRGAPLPGDGIWLDGGSDTANAEGGDRILAYKFGYRREILAKHLYIARDKGPLINV
jgi:hypothetical protein